MVEVYKKVLGCGISMDPRDGGFPVLLHLHHQTLQFFGEPPVPTVYGYLESNIPEFTYSGDLFYLAVTEPPILQEAAVTAPIAG